MKCDFGELFEAVLVHKSIEGDEGGLRAAR